MEHQAFCLVRSIQWVMLPKFQAKLGFTGSSTHDSAVCKFKAYWSVTALQTYVRQQSIPHQAYPGPSINKDIRDHFLPSTHYPHLQVQLPLIAMWCTDESHRIPL